MRALALLTLALLVAGCVQPPDVGQAADDAVGFVEGWAERALPYGPKHDHYDIGMHAGLTTPNFEVVGWDPLVSASKGKTAGGYFCGEIANTTEGRRIAVVSSYTTDVAFAIADVTDPAAPVWIGEYVLPYTMTYDVAISPDGMHVLVATNAGDQGPDGSAAGEAVDALQLPSLGVRRVQPMFRDACTGETRAVGPEQTLPLAPATLLVGIQDPENPALEDAHPAPVLGVHSISTGMLGGEVIVGSSITNLVHQASYFQFFRILDTPLGARLALESVYQTPTAGSTDIPLMNGHVDVSFLDHPVTGQPLAYVANWDAGMVILDMSNPKAPLEIGRFNEWTGDGSYMEGVETGNLHETLPIEGLWDDRHYVLAGQEILNHPEDHPTGWVWIIDDTDPTNPTLAGKWTLPVDVEWERALQFSTHYVEVVGRTMFVTLYHGGLWAADLSTPEAIADPPTIGAFVPDNWSPNPPEVSPSHGVEGTPNVLDVLAYPNGDIVVFDASSGLYMVRFDAAMPSVAPPTWLSQV